ncbi:MAG: [FeFe] hydrogenase H-cluster radical SAM maturase HydE [Candidatus Kapaibacteriota bacterium]
MENIEKLLKKDKLGFTDLVSILSLETPQEIEMIRSRAYTIMKENVGETVYLRGLIEFSNICINDCYYCGIRKSNSNIKRYLLEENQVLKCVDFAVKNGYASIVLQSGERRDRKFLDYVCRLVEKIKATTRNETLPDGVAITLCVGEQSYKDYQRFFDAGAERYLLRIETSNPELFAKIHPENVSFENRKECLHYLRDIGFQVGTGVMIGLPNQTIEDLANDILFFEEIDADMIGMGPYIVHKETPFALYFDEFQLKREKIFNLALKMIAATRLYLKDVNIASTTALDAIYPYGREEGLRFGANVIMPMLTPEKFRKDYLLYEGKPYVEADTSTLTQNLIARITNTGRKVGFNQIGTSKHYRRRVKIKSEVSGRANNLE